MSGDILAWGPCWEGRAPAAVCSAALRLTGSPEASWEAACRWLHDREGLERLQLALYAPLHTAPAVIMAVRADPQTESDVPAMLFNRALRNGLAQCLEAES